MTEEELQLVREETKRECIDALTELFTVIAKVEYQDCIDAIKALP